LLNCHCLLQCMSPLLAQGGHPDALNQCPLLGLKRTFGSGLLKVGSLNVDRGSRTQVIEVVNQSMSALAPAPARGANRPTRLYLCIGRERTVPSALFYSQARLLPSLKFTRDHVYAICDCCHGCP